MAMASPARLSLAPARCRPPIASHRPANRPGRRSRTCQSCDDHAEQSQQRCQRRHDAQRIGALVMPAISRDTSSPHTSETSSIGERRFFAMKESRAPACSARLPELSNSSKLPASQSWRARTINPCGTTYFRRSRNRRSKTNPAPNTDIPICTHAVVPPCLSFSPQEASLCLWAHRPERGSVRSRGSIGSFVAPRAVVMTQTVKQHDQSRDGSGCGPPL